METIINLTQFQEVNIELMPTDIMINIFDRLNLVDVMSSASISLQSQIASEYYYSHHFKSLNVNQLTLMTLSNNPKPDNLEFAEKMLRTIGCHITGLTIDFTTFGLNTINTLSKLIQKHCTNLEEVVIICFPDVQIVMPAIGSLQRLEAFDCWFETSNIASNNLKSLEYSRQANGQVTDLSQLLSQFPGIIDLNVVSNKISNENFKDIASLKQLEILSVEILRPEHLAEKYMLDHFCNVDEFTQMLQTTESLREFQLVTPFFKRLRDATVDIHIRALRNRTNVSLVLTAFDDLEPRYAYVDPSLLRLGFMEVADFYELREDLRYLNALRASITFEGDKNMVCMERMAQLEVLQLSLVGNCVSQSHRVDDVLWSLHSGANRWTCRLRELGLNADYTTPVGKDTLPSILAFVRIASKLTQLTIINCTEELIAMKVQVEKERHGLKVLFE